MTAPVPSIRELTADEAETFGFDPTGRSSPTGATGNRAVGVYLPDGSVVVGVHVPRGAIGHAIEPERASLFTPTRETAGQVVILYGQLWCGDCGEPGQIQEQDTAVRINRPTVEDRGDRVVIHWSVGEPGDWERETVACAACSADLEMPDNDLVTETWA